MLNIPKSTIDKIDKLTKEQQSILTALINEFYFENIKSDISRRIGIAKGKFIVPANFDEMDFDTLKLFGIE